MVGKKEAAASIGSGLPENVAGALAYLLGPITGVLFLVLEKKSKFVRFHAMQSLITFGGLLVISLILGVVPLLGWFVGMVLNLVGILLWVVLLVKAYQGEMYKLPYIGEVAEKQLGKMG